MNGTQFIQGKKEPCPAPKKYICWVCGNEFQTYNNKLYFTELNMEAVAEVCEACWLSAEESFLIREIGRHNASIPGEIIERKVQDLIVQYRDPVHFSA